MAQQRARQAPNRRFERLREQFAEMNRVYLALFLAGGYLFLAIVGPLIYPAARRGLQCSDLAAPLGGNNRSVLALSGNDPQELKLELKLENSTIQQGDPLRVNVRFVNQDIGPVILYLERGRPPINTVQTVGLRFEIRNLADTPMVDEGARPLPAGWRAVPIDSERLHLLGSRARCNESFSLPLTLQPGDYRIRAFYFNDFAGIWESNVPPGDELTPTQAYQDQGVWTRTDSIVSEEIRFTISPPGP
jgi:hypothetical protein